ncbi:ATP-binding protein [Nonomuraea soli]|uniref:Putative ATPase n=1 Tax=Nonomuraea soli TaxID=1032476 RepID=A0A7W0CRU9_9ACTN|nr:BTAD domain-containing putative transcriptional regulator [Nonomuraea soli]MBA2896181.1 putative ATPase [Nonomuraea soli]
MRFRILGTTEVAGEPVPGRGLQMLLSELLMAGGAAVPEQRLRHDGATANALQSQISRLRKLVPVERTPAGYRLPADPEEVDAHLFTRLAAEGERALRAGRPADAAGLLREALDLWRGEAALDGLNEARQRAMEHRVEADLRLGAPVVEELRELVREHPLRERPRVLLIRALARDGREAEALSAFEEGRRLLGERLGADPSAELQRLHVQILRGEHGRRPSLRAPLTSFVGRDAELATLGDLLARRRLVTLTGPGGAGKTRLAVEAARRLEAGGGRSGGRVVLVELAPATEVAPAVLAAAGGGSDPVDALAGESGVLLLDNCEHVLAEAAGLVARLLDGCPDLRVLATSREPLGLDGESVLPVQPLPARVAESLLVDRARAVRPDFEPSEAVARICRSLDGLPLAIELAAARLRALSAEDLADRLDLDLLASRTAPPRHRTLRAVVSWSWELLCPRERRLAARLSIFPSGATLAAAEQVCGATPGLLAALVDKSLVQADGGRYRMLETVRAFCAEQLGDDPVRQAHAEFFARLTEEAEPYLRNHRQLAALAELAAEHDNLNAALHWAIGAGHAGIALRMTGSLWFYWWLRGLRHHGARLSLRALDLPGADQCGEHYVMSVLQVVSAGPPEPVIRPLMEVAERLAAGLDHPLVRMVHPMTAIIDGDYAALIPALLRSSTEPQPWLRGFAELMLGLLRSGGGELARADRHLDSALTAFRLAGDRWGAAQAMLQQALIAGLRGDHRTELAITDQALALTAPFGATEDTSGALSSRGLALARCGDLDGARRDLLQAAEVARTRETEEMLAIALFGLGEVARLGGEPEQALELYGQALAGCETLWVGAEEVRARILIGLGQVTGDAGLHREAFAVLMRTLDLPAAAEAVEGLAALEPAGERAALLQGAAAALRGVPGTRTDDAYVRGAAMSRAQIVRLVSAPRAGCASAAAHR